MQIWRLNPHPAPGPSGISRLQGLIARNVTVARAGWQPIWWLLALAFAGTLLALLRVERRVQRALTRRAVTA